MGCRKNASLFVTNEKENGLTYKGGDLVASFEDIYKEYFHIVYGYLLTLTNMNRSLSEELTQETFFRAMRKISSFRNESKLSTWLCQIAKYTYFQSIDKEKRRKEVSMEEAFHLESQSDIEEDAITKEGTEKIYQAIDKLKPEMRDIVLLHIHSDLTFKEIGEILSISENKARVSFYRAKQILGKELLTDE